MAAGFGWPAAAQRYAGDESPPNVIVDYSVLDELGREPNVPQLFLQNPTGSAYQNNPYRTGPKFPVIANPARRAETRPLALTPPTAPRQQVSRKPVRKTVQRPRPSKRKKVVRRTPTQNRLPPATTPRAVPPPAPSVTDLPAPVVPPPPEIAPVQPQKMATASTEKAVSAAPKAPEPPPLPPVSAPKQAARSTPPPPPPAPPSAAIQPPPAAPASPTRSASAATPVPKAKPARTVRAKPDQVASLPKAPTPVRSGSLRRIEFPPGSATLSSKASLGLQNIASALSRDSGLRIQLLAYAGQSGDSASQARRLSLSRALAARSKLIEQGVRSTRIDVRALGNKSAGGPADRIDIIVTKR